MIPKEAYEDNEIMDYLLSHRLVVGAPKNEKDLRVQYAEMFDHPEFSRSRLKNSDDVLFVWWYACACSPYFDDADEKRLDKCIMRAYKSDGRRDQKRNEYNDGKFPDEIKAAIKRMHSLNTGVRIENFARLLRIRKNCHALLDEDVETMTDEQKDAWTKRAKGLWNLLEETQRAIERGSFGVSDAEDTLLEEDGDDGGALRDARSEVNR